MSPRRSRISPLRSRRSCLMSSVSARISLRSPRNSCREAPSRRSARYSRTSPRRSMMSPRMSRRSERMSRVSLLTSRRPARNSRRSQRLILPCAAAVKAVKVINTASTNELRKTVLIFLSSKTQVGVLDSAKGSSRCRWRRDTAPLRKSTQRDCRSASADSPVECVRRGLLLGGRSF